MTIEELKEKIQYLPDEMEVVEGEDCEALADCYAEVRVDTRVSEKPFFLITPTGPATDL